MEPRRTLVGKVWEEHVIVASPQGEDLLYVDLGFINEGQTFLGFDQMRMEGRTVKHPHKFLAVTDHYLPTKNRHLGAAGFDNPEIRKVVDMLASNSKDFALPHIGMHHPKQGIAHVIGPELGFSQPGMLITCNDSHTTTHGAYGAIGLPVGASNQLRHVLVTQTVWMRRPKNMRIVIDGTLPHGVTSKDVILGLIARIGIGGGVGYAIEFAGSAVDAMSMEARMTLCNMSVEAGARVGMIAPDDTTYLDLHGRRMAPKGRDWDKALAYWKTLPTDAGALFDREIALPASELAPMVSWGTNPQDCSSIDGSVPDPTDFTDQERVGHVRRALEYMDLRPGTRFADIAIDRVFIGSCVNSRIEDLRAAALVLKGRKSAVPGMVSPGSTDIKHQAEAEGLDAIFVDAGLEWRDAGCAQCNSSNGEVVLPGERCASTTNRNFEGRQGRGARTHIMSPIMVAAAAVTGRLTDARTLIPQTVPLDLDRTRSGKGA